MKSNMMHRWSFGLIAGTVSLLWLCVSPSVQAAPFNLRLVVQNTETNYGAITQPTNVPPRMPTGVWIPVAGDVELVAQANAGYAFNYWQVDSASTVYFDSGSNSPSTFLTHVAGDTNVIITARFKLQDLSLTVISTNNWGSPMTPSIGVSTWPNGTNITASVTTPFVIGGGAQAICTGYVGSGSVPALGTTPSVAFQLTTNSTLTWLWRVQADSFPLRISSTNSSGYPVGNPVPRAGVTNVPYNQEIQAFVSSPWSVSADERAVVTGYRGTGSAPTGNGPSTPAFPVQASSTLDWIWRSEYLLRVEIDGEGSVARSPGGTPEGNPPEGWWYPAGTAVSLFATPTGEQLFLGWSGDIAGVTPTNSVLMSGPRTIKAVFGLVKPDNDLDGMPDEWESQYGLDPYSAAGMSGAFGDPDNDGLNNLQEYEISYVLNTNFTAYVECNPIHADSDSDGLDDGYEYYNILFPGATNAVAGSQRNYLAPVDSRGANGPDGNPDGDFLWNTVNGYRTDVGLTTGQEYIGPDGKAPGVWFPPVNMSAYGLALPVNRYRNEADPLFPTVTGDTFDQSSSDSTDSEIASDSGTSGDGFDDGFEYSWDQWQAEHGGELVGDPLNHRVPYRFAAAPEEPTAALLAPWFHTPVGATITNDLAVSVYNYDQVNFFVNLGKGQLIPTSSVPVGAGPVAMALGAFDGAASDDIVVANQKDNSISVLLATPTGATPFAVASYAFGPANASNTFVTVGLFNADTHQDVAVCSAGDGYVTVLTNNGAGVFGVLTRVSVGGAPSCIASGRVFGEIPTNVPAGGVPFADLVVADGVSSVISLRNQSNGTFSVSGTTSVGLKTTSVGLVDLNGDLKNDIVVTISDNSTIQSRLGDGSGTFVLKGTEITGENGYPVHLALGNLNYSYDPSNAAYVASLPLDVSVSAFSNRTGRPFMGISDGTLSPKTSAALNMRPVWSVIGDVDQDNINDVVYVCRPEDQVSIWVNQNDGTLIFKANYGSSPRSSGRPFNPGIVHIPPPGIGWPDYDLIYLPLGGVGNWYSDDLEYNAWTTGTVMFALSSNLIVRTEYPDRPRSSHPFLWDADWDGLPDGWEVMFGYDSWKKVSFGGAKPDSDLNPDLDGCAFANGLYHHDYYESIFIPPNGATNGYHNFNPNTGWLDPIVEPINPPRSAATVAFNNRLEMLGGRPAPASVPFDPEDQSSNPFTRDTDSDGIWDGWEQYVDLNPIDPTDAGLPDRDNDGLSQVQEFLCPDTLAVSATWTYATNADGTVDLVVPGIVDDAQIRLLQDRIQFVQSWPNKVRPTDPFDSDTDSDQIADGGERGLFNVVALRTLPTMLEVSNPDGTSTPIGLFYGSGGLSPTAVDTDNDFMPDYWESSYAGVLDTNGVITGGMDGTIPDYMDDPDGDGLRNYQEYMTGCIYDWQYMYNSGEAAWEYGLGIYGYEPWDFFNDSLSWSAARPNGDAMMGPGGRRPKYWDPHYWVNPLLGKPFHFVTAAEPPLRPRYFSTSDPGDPDSDWDGMDDYWETFHMLNPVLGAPELAVYGLARDLVYEKFIGRRPAYPMFPPPANIIFFPWVNGRWELDWDQDGLPNVFETVQPASPDPQFYHTDPSPNWLSDWSYDQSWVNLYYWTGTYFAYRAYWWWDPGVIPSLPPPFGPWYAPDHIFAFESHEGFDTDNDNLPDRAELVDTAASPGSTDPIDGDDPIKHRALYLNGEAALRTYGPTASCTWEQLRTFAVMAWVRPQTPVLGQTQTVLERPCYVANGNPMGAPTGIRLNFQLGLDENGRPYVGYHGAGYDPIFQMAKAEPSGTLRANQWAHLAGVYDGTAKRLILYVNGIVAAMTPTAEIPFNSWYGGNPGNPSIPNQPVPVTSPLMVGASDLNPAGWVDGEPFHTTVSAGLWAGYNMLRQDPVLASCFRGWVDEVRVYSGPKSQSDVRGLMRRRFTHREAQAYNNSVGGRLSPQALLYAYNFDNLPDPDHHDVAPPGFGLLTGYMPGYTAIPWWSKAPDTSRVYTDYRYVPWMENLSEHVALNPPIDTTIVYDPVTNRYPNTSNPYTFVYEPTTAWNTQWHPKGSGSVPGVGAADLLPLRWAVADQDLVMWDNQTTDQVYDEDGDGMPDDWEVANGLNPRDAMGENGADGDPDGDGLSNFYEYRCGTDPWGVDSDGDGTWDADEDSDGDGLINAVELARTTLPDNMDTDDDGLTDWEEVTGFTDTTYDGTRPATSPRPLRPTSPINPLEPVVARSVYLDGDARVIVPPRNKLMSPDWTLEMWVKPDTNSMGGVLVCRYVAGMVPSQNGINYEMGLTTNAPAGKLRPYIRYASTTNNVEREVRLSGVESNAMLDPAVSVTISNDVWTHVAGTYDSMSNRMALYVNGKLATWRNDAIDMPPVGFGYAVDHEQDEVTIGASRSSGTVSNGFKGYLDEVRIWSVTRSAADIGDRYNAPEGEPGGAGTIPLKSRIVAAVGGLAADVLALPAGQPVHALVQFATEADAGAKTVLESSGIKVMYHVGAKARVVTATREQLVALGGMVSWSGLLKPADKIAAKLAVDGTHGSRKVLVQFHKDVAQSNALAAVQAVGGAVYNNKYIGGAYLVATLSDLQVMQLAANDGVVWVLPAAEFLTTGSPVRLSAPHTVGGVEVAPFVLWGNGWDGPGLGSADLTYHFMNDTTKLPPAAARASVVEQLRKWEAVAALTFTETAQQGLSRSLDIGWFVGAHGDGADFDGPLGELAHAAGPDDTNPEPFAGDLHFDDDEDWQIGVTGSGIDMASTALHELGHTIGLDHSDDPNAIMYPFYNGVTELQQDDINGIQSIYGKPVVPGGTAGVGIYRFDDGGLTAQDFAAVNDWLTGWASAAVLDGAFFSTNTAPNLDKDSDGDGMPDWWEMTYGLDPYDATGNNGAYGDIDSDGLANLYEYLSGTSPADPDSDNDGFSDYDSRNGPGNRTFGELFDDGDGIPDQWEIQYRGPCPATGIRGLDPAYYDAQLDPDRDGWSNYAEYMSGTDPLSGASFPIPSINLHVRYKGRLGPSLDAVLVGGTGTNSTGIGVVMNFYTTPAMDGFADASFTTVVASNTIQNVAVGHIREGNNYVFAFLDMDNDGEWNPALEPAGIAQFQPINFGWGDVNRLEIGLTDDMPGYPRFAWPDAPEATRYVITNFGPQNISRIMQVPRSYWHEGDWLYAGHYGVNTGVYAISVFTNAMFGNYANFSGLVTPVVLSTPSIATPHDTVYVYARNELEFRRDTNATAYRLQIALATNLAPVITTTNIVPYLDNGVSKAALPIYAGDNYVPTNSSYASSTWTNGRYWVRVQVLTPYTQSAYSAWSAINFNLQPPTAGGKSVIGGDVYYFGKVGRGYGNGQASNLTIIVQAFESPGFSGVADAQVQVTYACDTNAPSSKKGDYTLMGLGDKQCYVRAFIDMNGNRMLDPFEPMGFARENTTTTDYRPLAVDVRGQAGVTRNGIRIVIRDRDTDDDQLPDGWEWMYYGTLTRGAYDIGSNTLTLLRNYEIEPLDLDPTKTDYDADGLEDVFEITYSDGITYAQYLAGQRGDVNHYDPYPHGRDLNPTLWDTDADGLSDGYEILNGLDPLDPNGDADGDGVNDALEVLVTRTSAVAASDVLKVKQVAAVTPGQGLFSLTWTGKDGVSYQVQYSDDLKTWQNAPLGVFSGAADHVYVEQSPSVNVRYYRVVTK